MAAALDTFNIPYFDDTPRTPRSERSLADSQPKVHSAAAGFLNRSSPRPAKRRSVLPPTKTALLQYIAYKDQPSAERLSLARRQLLNFGHFRPSLTSGSDLPTKQSVGGKATGGSCGDLCAEQRGEWSSEEAKVLRCRHRN